MQLLNVLFGLLFAIVVAAQDAGAPKELVIETTYAPPECSIKSQKGDVVKVHYVRSCFCNAYSSCWSQLSLTDWQAVLKRPEV